jgi:hypothetical protein
LAPLGVLVQVPVLSRFLNLRPLHGTDWALVAVAFVVVTAVTRALASRMRQHPS